MAIWKEQIAPKKEPTPVVPEPILRQDADTPTNFSASYDAQRKPAMRETKESLIASDIIDSGLV